MHRNKIITKTKRGTLLNGVLWTSNTSDTVLIAITGIHGNYFTNYFYCNIGDKLATEDIDFIYAETCNAFPRLETYNANKNEIENIGSYNERFSYVDEDVESFINKAKELGYKHIYIAGHSLGANKVIHYLSNNKHNIEHYLLLSPADVSYMTRKDTVEQKHKIAELIRDGRGEEECPYKIMGWLECINYTANDWLNNNILDNIFSVENKERDYYQMSNIDIDGAFIVGTDDIFGNNDVRTIVNSINDRTKYKEKNIITILENTNHLYKGKETELSESILSIVKKWKA